MDSSGVLNELRTLLSGAGRQFQEIRGGIAIEFRDGCDALFVTEETIIDLPSPDVLQTESNEVASRIFAEFQRLERNRGQVLLGLRHHAARLKVAIQPTADGCWGIQTEGGCTSEVRVGAHLTRLARSHDSAEALRKLLEFSILRKPSPKRAAKLVAMAGPPEQEQRWRSEEEAAIRFDPAAFLVFDCHALDDEQLDEKSPQQIADALTHHRDSPGLQVVLGLRERLGKDSLSVDLLGNGGADFDFSDDMDHLRVFPQGKRMARLIEELGVQGTVERLEEQYSQLDRARTQTLNGLKTIMATHGYALHACDSWWFGKTHRELSFDPGKSLTRKLKKQSPIQLITEWFSEKKPFACPTAKEIKQAIDGRVQEPKRHTLASAPLGNGPWLPAYEELDLAELDRKAADFIDRIKAIVDAPKRKRLIYGENPLWWWGQARWYRRGQDTWTDEAWWMEFAKRAWEEEECAGANQMAAMILLVNGDDCPRAPLLEYFQTLEYYHDEACDDGIAWLLRNELPWQIDLDDMPAYPPVLGSPPPQVAREIAMGVRAEIQTASHTEDSESADERLLDVLETAAALDRQSAAEWLRPSEIDLLHQRCRQWAADTNDFYKLRLKDPLVAAARFGWTDIVDVLDANPAYIPAVLQREPSFMETGSLAQELTLVAPGPLAARFAAHAMTLDIEAEALAATEEICRIPDIAKYAPMMQENYEKSLRVGQSAGAVAWTRCRATR